MENKKWLHLFWSHFNRLKNTWNVYGYMMTYDNIVPMPHVASSNRLFLGVQTDCRPGASWWVPGSRPNCALWMPHEDTVQPPQHPSPPARTLRMLAWSAAARQTSSSAAQLSEELFGFAPSSSTLYLSIFYSVSTQMFNSSSLFIT